ncbi:hypothetical protein CEXT_208321 [Caerostris extrusa]|uniref:Uncharacterized protein n=1 Tax=Caerostris extrusa TaxID=172846 RepID=A0AAV4U0X2_CAEEX|nr:hypothetical protein CEXT_208321 [Caerostris extrusa]
MVYVTMTYGTMAYRHCTMALDALGGSIKEDNLIVWNEMITANCIICRYSCKGGAIYKDNRYPLYGCRIRAFLSEIGL